MRMFNAELWRVNKAEDAEYFLCESEEDLIALRAVCLILGYSYYGERNGLYKLFERRVVSYLKNWGKLYCVAYDYLSPMRD